MTLLYSQQQLEIREVLLRDKPASLLQSSPKGTVPVLVLVDNSVLQESLDIIHWSLHQQDRDNWWTGLNNQQQQQISTLIEGNDGNFKYWLDRYKYADRYPEQTADNYRQQAEVSLSELEQRLGRHDFLIHDQITLADIALFPFIRQFAFVDKHWFDHSDYRHLQRWLDYFLSSALFSRVMNKYLPWKLGDQPVYYGDAP
jgi:glutathione S-transferase